MRILYIAQKNDYKDPKRGLSFEHYNLYDSLVRMGGGMHEVEYFPFDEVESQYGRDKMNTMLEKKALSLKPDLCFFFLFTEEIYPVTIKKITDSGIITYNWFADDHWRFPIFTARYAPFFSWVSTTDVEALSKYEKIGYNNVIQTQWACNSSIYHPLNPIQLSKKYLFDVTFVGQKDAKRERMVQYLKKKGVDVQCFGGGWNSGRVEQSEMIKIFEHSKINLNFSESNSLGLCKDILKIFFRRQDGKIIANSPFEYSKFLSSYLGRKRRQIKGRVFEVPGCGGFLISGMVAHAEEYFVPGKEMVFYDKKTDLVEKIKYYLANEEEREAIRIAGYEKTVRVHTYEHRLSEIFSKIFK